MEKIEFGKFIKVKAQAIRKHKYEGAPRRIYKTWTQEMFNEIKTGIFLGYRTLSNGYTVYYSDEGYIYTPQSYVTCALVCLSPRTNPIYVFLEDIIHGT